MPLHRFVVGQFVALACCLGLDPASAIVVDSTTLAFAGSGACSDSDSSNLPLAQTSTASSASCNGSWSAATSEVDRMSARVRVTATASGPAQGHNQLLTVGADSRAVLHDVWTVTVSEPASTYADAHFFVKWFLTVEESPDRVYYSESGTKALVAIYAGIHQVFRSEEFMDEYPASTYTMSGGAFIDSSFVGTQQYDIYLDLRASSLEAGSVDYSLYLTGEWQDGVTVTNDLGAIALAVPEPNSGALLLAGLSLAVLVQRKWRGQRSAAARH